MGWRTILCAKRRPHVMITLFFVLAYGYPLGMIGYAYWDHRKKVRELERVTGVRL